MGITNIKRCGTCHFGEIIAQDLTKRVCFGAPPAVNQFPAANGQVMVRMARPVVGVIDRACAVYRDKDASDNERDDDTFRELQGQRSLFETKQ